MVIASVHPSSSSSSSLLLRRKRLHGLHPQQRDVIVFMIGCCLGSIVTNLPTWIHPDAGVQLSSSDLTSSLSLQSSNDAAVLSPQENHKEHRISSIKTKLMTSSTFLKTTINTTTDSSSSLSDGWNSIDIYYGKMNHLIDPIPEKFWRPSIERQLRQQSNGSGLEWFGQHGQDVAVAKALGFIHGGYFVDLAANDAVWASNTFALEQHFAWHGICIEANPQYWHRLSFRVKCHTVGAIAGSTDGIEVEVALNPKKETGPYSGIIGDDFDNKKKSSKKGKKNGSNDNVVKRYTVALRTILERYNAPLVIDYLSLDVEGAETFIMKDFSWDVYTFKVMTVERPSKALQSIFQSHGYQKVLEIKRGDTMWAHDSVSAQVVLNLQKDRSEIERHSVRIIPNKRLKE